MSLVISICMWHRCNLDVTTLQQCAGIATRCRQLTYNTVCERFCYPLSVYLIFIIKDLYITYNSFLTSLLTRCKGYTELKDI